jgi:hypothetical protein
MMSDGQLASESIVKFTDYTANIEDPNGRTWFSFHDARPF